MKRTEENNNSKNISMNKPIFLGTNIYASRRNEVITIEETNLMYTRFYKPRLSDFKSIDS